jgi:hypothetical protein
MNSHWNRPPPIVLDHMQLRTFQKSIFQVILILLWRIAAFFRNLFSVKSKEPHIAKLLMEKLKPEDGAVTIIGSAAVECNSSRTSSKECSSIHAEPSGTPDALSLSLLVI